MEDYTEEMTSGYREQLEKVRKITTVIAATDIDPKWWEQRKNLYRFLRRYTSDHLRQLIEAVGEENG